MNLLQLFWSLLKKQWLLGNCRTGTRCWSAVSRVKSLRLRVPNLARMMQSIPMRSPVYALGRISSRASSPFYRFVILR